MSEAGPTQRFIGGGLMAVGVVIMSLCGLCTAWGMSVALGDHQYGGAETAVMALVIGGVPFAVGLGLFLAGKALRGGPSLPPPPETFT